MYRAVEIEAADSIHLTGSDDWVGGSVKGPVESRLDAEEVVEAENPRELALVLSQAQAPAQVLVLAIPKAKLHATMVLKTKCYRELSERMATFRARLMLVGT